MSEQPLDALISKLGLTNAQVVNASTEQLSFKQLQKARAGENLSPKIQNKILNALVTLKPELKLRRRDLFQYEPTEELVREIEKALSLVQQKKIKYPEFVDMLSAAGVNRYEVDLATGRIIYYASAGQTHVEQAPGNEGRPGAFDEDLLKTAIAAAQNDKIDYPAFLKRIYVAGIVRYDVNLYERVIRYRGEAETYKERIPAVGEEPKAAEPKIAAKPKAVKKPKSTGKVRIKKSRKFVHKHRTKKGRY